MKGKSVASLVLGILSLVFWLIPLFGLPISIVGLVMGVLALKQNVARGMAIAGVIMSSIGLVLVIINAAVGAYMGATGQLGF
ncbi:MAG: DUF4190 domain-containing protein [Lachnospiraceae bacterium]|nr:DUF4190 domain-containing protein [Lachnospiraceae bacterium]